MVERPGQMFQAQRAQGMCSSTLSGLQPCSGLGCAAPHPSLSPYGTGASAPPCSSWIAASATFNIIYVFSATDSGLGPISSSTDFGDTLTYITDRFTPYDLLSSADGTLYFHTVPAVTRLFANDGSAIIWFTDRTFSRGGASGGG